LRFRLHEGAAVDEVVDLAAEGTELVAGCGGLSIVKLRNYLVLTTETLLSPRFTT
jgi:hypothetical protein